MAADMKPMIRIDDPRTIILSDEQKKSPCCLCLKENSKSNSSKYIVLKINTNYPNLPDMDNR